MKIMGIDPGLSGGLTLIEMAGDWDIIPIPRVMPVLEMGGKRVLDVHSIIGLMAELVPEKVFIERVHAMPKNGAVSMYNFGFGCGLIEGIIAGLGIPYEYVTPQKWMADVLAGYPKDGKASIVYCQQRFPGTDWRATPRCKNADSGLTDSCCIALWGAKAY